MKNVRVFSQVMFPLCRGYGMLMLLVAVYAALVLSIGDTSGLLVRLPAGRFTISYPFSHTAFLIGDFGVANVLTLLGAVISYAVFVLMLGNIFKVLREEKIFTRAGVRALTWFYSLNFIVPLIALVLAAVAGWELKDFVMLAVLHGVIGIFAWIMAHIFKAGVALQDEQDQTL